MPGANNFIYEKNMEIMQRAKQKKKQKQNNNQELEINNPENNQKMSARRWKLRNKLNVE